MFTTTTLHDARVCLFRPSLDTSKAWLLQRCISVTCSSVSAAHSHDCLDGNPGCRGVARQVRHSRTRKRYPRSHCELLNGANRRTELLGCFDARKAAKHSRVEVSHLEFVVPSVQSEYMWGRCQVRVEVLPEVFHPGKLVQAGASTCSELQCCCKVVIKLFNSADMHSPSWKPLCWFCRGMIASRATRCVICTHVRLFPWFFRFFDSKLSLPPKELNPH